jgi:hypothetical protein
MRFGIDQALTAGRSAQHAITCRSAEASEMVTSQQEPQLASNSVLSIGGPFQRDLFNVIARPLFGRATGILLGIIDHHAR